MIHVLDPTAAAFISIGYFGFVAHYLFTVSPAGRKSRAGKSVVYLLVVFTLCALTSYVIQFFPDRLMWVREIEGWLLAVASIGLFVSGCGIRLGKAMDYECTLKKLDAANARIAELERKS